MHQGLQLHYCFQTTWAVSLTKSFMDVKSLSLGIKILLEDLDIT